MCVVLCDHMTFDPFIWNLRFHGLWEAVVAVNSWLVPESTKMRHHALLIWWWVGELSYTWPGLILVQLEKKWLPRTEAAEKRARDAIAQVRVLSCSDNEWFHVKNESVELSSSCAPNEMCLLSQFMESNRLWCGSTISCLMWTAQFRRSVCGCLKFCRIYI